MANDLKQYRGRVSKALFDSMCDKQYGLMDPPQQPRVAMRMYLCYGYSQKDAAHYSGVSLPLVNRYLKRFADLYSRVQKIAPLIDDDVNPR
ncbi:hypothetical protein CGI23_25330 [Vibrio parahaemolyticus]|nr:hypothetical protein CGI23_25330 [Vibrio parahaemolyticus]